MEGEHIRMGSTAEILRRSIYTFLRNYQYFTTAPLLLILPFSASVLLSQAFSAPSSPPSLLIQSSFNPFFHPAEPSLSTHLLPLLNNDLYQTILTSVFTLFFALSTLLTAKALIIQSLIHPKPSPSLPFSSFKSLIITQLCNSLLMIPVNSISLSLIFVIFHTLKSFKLPPNNPLLLPLFRSIFYSSFATAAGICNLALVVTGFENYVGFWAIHRAGSMSWRRNSVLLSTNLSMSFGVFAVEGLFNYRIVRAYYRRGHFSPSMAMEGILIAHLHSILVVLDTIGSCIFFKICKSNYQSDYEVGKKQDGKMSSNSEIAVVVP